MIDCSDIKTLHYGLSVNSYDVSSAEGLSPPPPGQPSAELTSCQVCITSLFPCLLPDIIRIALVSQVKYLPQSNLAHQLLQKEMAKIIKSFKFIGNRFVDFLSGREGLDHVEGILSDPLSLERCRLFMKTRERTWALSNTCGRLWENSGSSRLLCQREDSVMSLLASTLYELLISAKYHPDIGKILTMRGIPLEKGMPNFDLFISVVLLPEISIEMAKFQFNGSYKLAEQQYLKFSRLLVKVIYIVFFILIYLMAATNLNHLCITLHCGIYTI